MISVKNLTKSFSGLAAVRDLNMEVAKGDIYGFIGPNGAGKSTTFKILCTILKPDSGQVTIGDVDIRKGGKIRSMVGYMPDMFGVYEDMTVYQYLDFFGAAYRIGWRDRKRLLDGILDLTDLAFKKEAMVKSLSRGMTQRLGVARVLIHDPALLILDEPASGLDPRARIELRELLKELASMGKTIILSSHILAELSEVCSRLGIIEQGQLAFEGTRAELNTRLVHLSTIAIETVSDDTELALRSLRDAPFTESVEREGEVLRLKVVDGFDAIHEIPTFLLQKQCRLLRFEQDNPSLEDAFMHLTQGKLQ